MPADNGVSKTRVALLDQRVPGHAGFATVPEAATYLQLSRAMVHKLIAAAKIPATRYGRAVRIPWSWLLKESRDDA
jgi:excisionase family DNA binding protein